MCTQNIVKAIKKMSVNDIRDFFENYYKRSGFSKESSYYSTKRLKRKDLLLLANKLIEEVPDPGNAKEKSVKQSEIITYKPKTFGTADKKSDITEHPKTSHKLPRTIRKGKKVDSNSSLYSDAKKSENVLNAKNMK